MELYILIAVGDLEDLKRLDTQVDRKLKVLNKLKYRKWFLATDDK